MIMSNRSSSSISISMEDQSKPSWKTLLNAMECRNIVDITATDWLPYPEMNYRFSLLVLVHNVKDQRVMINVSLSSSSPKIETLSVYSKAADFAEREIYDLYGIVFIGHKDLRRILTDYGFVGYPLRKDFPVIGYTEIYYSIMNKGIEMRKVMMSQEYRLLKTTQKQWLMGASNIAILGGYNSDDNRIVNFSLEEK